jgi:hypothetical protein
MNIMSGQYTKKPESWNVIGNICPGEVSEPQTVEVFTANNCTLTLEGAVNIDGNLIIPVKSATAW